MRIISIISANYVEYRNFYYFPVAEETFLFFTTTKEHAASAYDCKTRELSCLLVYSLDAATEKILSPKVLFFLESCFLVKKCFVNGSGVLFCSD